MSRYALPISTAAAVVTGIALVCPHASAAPAKRPAGSAAATASAHSGDINGDGYDDLAVGAAEATVNGNSKAGYVAVTYGSVSGANLGHHQQLTQSSAGLPGTPEAGDRFGSALAVGDVDGDGYADLVVGSYGEDIGTVKDTGMVTVVFGSASGLSDKAIAFHPAATAYLDFGSELAVGDYNRDGRQDIAIAAGADVDVVYGAENLRDTPSPKLNAITPPGGGIGVTGLKTGDVDGDGYPDLVTVAYEDDPADEGTLGVLPGSASGLGSKALGQSVGLPFADYAAQVGDINGDGKADVLIDTGFEDGPDDYKLRTFPGAAGGLDTAHPVVWSGSAVSGVAAGIADFDGDGHADVVVSDPGAPDSDGIQGAGALTVLHGSAGWLSASGAQKISLDTPGVSGVSEGGDRFGDDLTAVDLNGDGHPDLATGAPGKEDADGRVSLIYASTTGLTPTGSILFGSDSLDIAPSREGFGSTLDQEPH